MRLTEEDHIKTALNSDGKNQKDLANEYVVTLGPIKKYNKNSNFDHESWVIK
ncbi:MAG: hypothetical protein KK926_07380 [Methanomethylovorans sp.]|nr:hypothetical protein [Methanomethylovorans sp.]